MEARIRAGVGRWTCRDGTLSWISWKLLDSRKFPLQLALDLAHIEHNASPNTPGLRHVLKSMLFIARRKVPWYVHLSGRSKTHYDAHTDVQSVPRERRCSSTTPARPFDQAPLSSRASLLAPPQTSQSTSLLLSLE